MHTIGFYAYHGTSVANAKKIVEKQMFILGKNRHDHWLGYGAYFFREDYEQAKMWIDFKLRNNKSYRGESPAVVKAIVQYSCEKILNLDTRLGMQELVDFLQRLKAEGVLIKGRFKSIKKQTAEYVCAIFSLIPFDEKWVIIRTFGVPSKAFDGDENLSNLEFVNKDNRITFGLQGTQVCVRNQDSLKAGSIQMCEEANNIKRTIRFIKEGSISDEYFNR